VVDRLRIRFHPGLNLLTGETGSGKSIVVDRWACCWSARLAEMIRTGESRARVPASSTSAKASPSALLETAGIESDDGELLVEREFWVAEVAAFVGSRPVAVSLLKDLAPFLGDIQASTTSNCSFLPKPSATCWTLSPRTAKRSTAPPPSIPSGATPRGARIPAAHGAGKTAHAGFVELPAQGNRSGRARSRREIALENERRVLQNVQRLQEAAATAYTAVYDGPESALSHPHRRQEGR